jgi:hypothetical protein
MAVFLALARYKIKDTYATRQMLEHAISTMPAKGFTLHELRNLMITCEGRPRPDVCKFPRGVTRYLTKDGGMQSRKFGCILQAPAWIERRLTRYIPTC